MIVEGTLAEEELYREDLVQRDQAVKGGQVSTAGLT